MAPYAQPNDDRHWSLESLNKAYQQGYMAALAGHAQQQQPYRVDVMAAAWEAGWDDGDEQFQMRRQKIA